MSSSFRILVVCTGNICRSPMAAAMLTHHLREGLGEADSGLFEVSSAGTGAVVGNPMESHAVDALTGFGVVPDDFTARDITEQLIADADLILTATRQHRSAVVTTLPSAIRRTFTILEFARLAASLGDTTPSDPRVFVERVGAQRGLAPPGEDDVFDPYRQPAKRFVQTAAVLQPAIELIAARLVRAAGKGHREDGLPDDLQVESK